MGLPLHRDAGGAGGRVALHPFLAALVHVHRLLVVALTQDARRSMDESETRKAREEEVAPPLARELRRQARKQEALVTAYGRKRKDAQPLEVLCSSEGHWKKSYERGESIDYTRERGACRQRLVRFIGLLAVVQ